jgi:hypothetical protein
VRGRRLRHKLRAGGVHGNTFPGTACVVALVNGFAQHYYRVEIVGESYRDVHRLDATAPDAPRSVVIASLARCGRIQRSAHPVLSSTGYAIAELLTRTFPRERHDAARSDDIGGG